MSFSIKRLLPHVLILIGFVALSLAYFSPVLQGKKINQSDIMHYIGMAQQHKEFAKTTGEETYWTNSAFGGMPTYQLGAKYPHNYIKKLDLTLRFLPRPADYLFLYFIGFYILLLSLKVDFKLAALGALAFGFSTYLIIILGVGHNAKAHAIAYMPLVLAGIILTFRKKYILGFLLTTIALGLEIVANHFQMTYYLLLLVLVLGLAYLIDAYKKQLLPHFFKSVGLLSMAAIIAVGLNATNIMATQEYVKETTRGKSDLTINPDGSPKEATSGLSKDYITEYSYGILETFNLYIPKFMGGGNSEDVGKDSETYKAYIRLGASPMEALDAARHAPMYWGDQPIVEAPAYVGAVIIFLFVLGLFLVKGRLKWWLVGGTVLSLLLSYGKNFGLLTDFFIDFVPLYNKFRAVSSIQVILELCIPVLGIFALVRLFNDYEKDEEKLKALLYSVGITAGLALTFLLFKSTLFDFESFRDDQYIQAYGPQFIDAVIEDRKALMTSDTLRTLVLVLLSAGTVYLFLKKKLSETLVVVVFAALILFDLVLVDRQYVNNDNFVSAINVDKPYQPNSADLEIMKDKGHFRVFDMSSQGQRMPAKAAYYHNSLLGYHAAKLGRMNELLEFHVYQNNMNVLNMLNTKYIIAEDQNTIFPYTNTDANGNAWFVSSLKVVESANEEIVALDSLNTKTTAVLEKSVQTENKLKPSYLLDSLASIELKEFKPNYLKYESNNSNDGLAVFSEVYYSQGWNAYIDGNLVPHFRVNYVLRALEIPKGAHAIEFKFEPKVVETGSKIALASSAVLGLLLLFGVFYELKRRNAKA
ncbi:membrane protein YfhO [Winogradskyella epiphytica]|uniref:Membrane protein YfhO n=1 Tax=Winogradskyella epiphytica TaxID=262005 RepID=A0A2V4XFI9_9FLAO|nr:YfhO family protein [Winogradskyella epiphytica]PYE81825.1 membrane protein YfhO [Winogradskyella epiphytica]GGW62373.1 membrane protein [Winogradskyella epiphytica]